MVSVFDVAAFILSQLGPIPVMKLHKLAYYCQAWSLVWDEEPLFKERIEAWANGPVVKKLFEIHKGQFKLALSDLPGNPDILNEEQRETVLVVLKDYGGKPSQWLSDLTHLEAPWREARQGMDTRERGDKEITWAALAEYYGGLLPVED
ncbi:type II toxin-antitoxin system antitoxin SocA domain-containing protein [Candidatus Parabeggiatoa sp. HSG14]|uniref:Panacea domain-containing protein n=1 Tax=Candidatus Parabeggiatoa sp. HSG14 TaxID=3055593 RepID=UPI0025A81C98|nr:DUF4065 domain-containing protein [Thiotrichales bacterium HSG14]